MRQWRAMGIVAILLVSGCSGGSDSAELQALRDKVEALEAQTTTAAPTTTAARVSPASLKTHIGVSADIHPAATDPNGGHQM
ncbi:MAG: hypothetical protein QF637_01295 [Acidimicrobiales bacterium]|nr:hypothetical protein [Acidimicrobiales bacterium]